MTTEKTIKAGNHVITVEENGQKATLRINGKAICMGAKNWKSVVDAVAAGKFDDYISKYCTK